MSLGDREGEIPIQSPFVSSSTDVLYYYCSSNYHSPPRRPLRVTAYRPIHYYNPRPVSIPNLQRNRNPGSGGKAINSCEGNTRPIIIIASIFVLSLLALIYVYTTFPHLEVNEAQHVKIPWDIEDAKQLGRVLERYKDKYFFEVLLGVVVAYIFLQTFAIPGSISLSILSGFLFPFPLALTLVCFCSATGASLCYTLSFFVGRRIVYKYFPERAAEWALKVNKHRKNLINYILFLRMTPFLPNWFINIASPVIGVPLLPFYMGTFIGVAPPSFVAIQAGQTLYNLSASSDAWSWTSVVLLGLFSILSLVPVLLQNRIKEAVE